MQDVPDVVAILKTLKLSGNLPSVPDKSFAQLIVTSLAE